MRPQVLSATAINALPDLGDWRYVLGALRTDFRAGSFAAAADFLALVVAEADALDHHPDLDMRYPDRVRVVLRTHDVGGVTELDVQLARTISRLATQAGASVEPTTPQAIELAIDTMDADAIRPFWAAVLGWRDSGSDVTDPSRFDPPIWFQPMDQPRPDRNRIHVDISVPHEVAEQRVAAALAAGGVLVSDQNARAWWVLADADGNEACISTWQDR